MTNPIYYFKINDYPQLPSGSQSVSFADIEQVFKHLTRLSYSSVTINYTYKNGTEPNGELLVGQSILLPAPEIDEIQFNVVESI